MGLFRKGEVVNVLMFDKGGKELIHTKLRREGDRLVDSFVCKEYAIVTSPVFLRKGKKKKLIYLVDEEKGCTVEIKKNNELMELSTNPGLIGSVIGGGALQKIFAVKPEPRVILAGFVFGIILGFFLGAIFM
jgi:hypothetical protein